jgi:hypothetical protein
VFVFIFVVLLEDSPAARSIARCPVNLTNLTQHRLFQPYRTTPLVLPGAKVKKEAPPTSSYLRHHPNPKFRAPPSHYDTSAEVLMKQKVNIFFIFGIIRGPYLI